MKLGLVIMLAELQELRRAHSYPEIREMAIRAEAAGLDSIWLYDHLLYRNEERGAIGIWECWTVLSALAEATRKVELGSLVICNSFRNPAILAKMAVTLDEVSGGRFIFGLGAGWNKPEYEAFGLPYDHRVDRFEEALQIINPLLKTGRVDFSGKYYQACDCEIRPRGPSPQGPPLLIGSSGPRMLRLTARYADQWNTGYLGGPHTLEKPLAELRAACEAEDRHPQSLAVTGMVALAFPDLGEPPKMTEEVLSGTGQEIAEAMRGFERLGVAHLMFHLLPYREESFQRLVQAVQIYRGEQGK